MIEIILYNLVFWTIYYQICKMPERLFEYAIKHHGDMSKHRQHTTKYEDLCQ